MTARPEWSDSEQGDLLALVAEGVMATDTADREWDMYVNALRLAAVDGLIDPNVLRPLTRHFIAPQRVGAFTNRALSRGLVEYTGRWVVSDDATGRNGGKPCRELRLVEGALA